MKQKNSIGMRFIHVPALSTPVDPLRWLHEQNTGLSKDQSVAIGTCSVMIKVVLGMGCFGLVLLLSSKAEDRSKEMLETMKTALSDFDSIPPGMMDSLMENISLSNILLDHPRFDHFGIAIPLRSEDECRNYCYWDADKKDWRIQKVDFDNLKIETHTAMLIVKEKTNKPAMGAVAA